MRYLIFSHFYAENATIGYFAILHFRLNFGTELDKGKSLENGFIHRFIEI